MAAVPCPGYTKHGRPCRNSISEERSSRGARTCGQCAGERGTGAVHAAAERLAEADRIRGLHIPKGRTQDAVDREFALLGANVSAASDALSEALYPGRRSAAPASERDLGVSGGATGRYGVCNAEGVLLLDYESLEDAIAGVQSCLGAGSVVDLTTQEEVWRSTAEEEATFVPPVEVDGRVHFSDGTALRL